MIKWKLLSILYEEGGSFLSGERLSDMLKVSRTSIWKAIKELRSLGYNISSKTNVGYRLEPSFDILNGFEIIKRLDEKGETNFEVIYFKSLPSTNTYLKQIVDESKVENSVVIAEEQTAGRGRYNRTFYSSQNKGSYFSVSIKPNFSYADVFFVTIIAAISVVRTIITYTQIKPEIKWPNDILINDKKICGILTEAAMEGESNQIKYVVVGFGVNTNEAMEDFNNKIIKIATSLKIISNKNFERCEIIANILYEFNRLLKIDKKQILQEYKKYLIIDRNIKFTLNGNKLTGVIRDIDDNGHLLVETQTKILEKVLSGEIEFLDPVQCLALGAFVEK